MAEPMASSTVAPSPSLRRKLVARIVLVAVGLIVAGAVAGGGWLYYALHSSLPQLDGTLVVRGLAAPVSVVRDQHGVPHIKAESLDDVLFAQGYVTAQDRLWQMDMARRLAAGRLSEVLGSRAVEHDRRQRILGFERNAAIAANSLPAR